MTVQEFIQQFASEQYANGDDTGVVAISNEPTEPGSIDRRHISVTLSNFAGVAGVIKFVMDTKRMPAWIPVIGGAAVDSDVDTLWPLFCLFQNISFIANNTTNINIGVADIDAVVPLVAGLTYDPNVTNMGVIPNTFFTALKEGEIKIGKSERYLNRSMTLEMVSGSRSPHPPIETSDTIVEED